MGGGPIGGFKDFTLRSWGGVIIQNFSASITSLGTTLASHTHIKHIKQTRFNWLIYATDCVHKVCQLFDARQGVKKMMPDMASINQLLQSDAMSCIVFDAMSGVKKL